MIRRSAAVGSGTRCAWAHARARHLDASEVVVLGVISGPSLDVVASVGATIQERRHRLYNLVLSHSVSTLRSEPAARARVCCASIWRTTSGHWLNVWKRWRLCASVGTEESLHAHLMQIIHQLSTFDVPLMCYDTRGAGPGGHPSHLTTAEVLLRANLSRRRWRRWSLAYTPDWETLADALKRVILAGSAEQQAKADICNAVADRKIAARVFVDDSHQLDRRKMFSGGNVGVPSRLDPDDFDWSRSRPFKKWFIGPMPGQHYFWNGDNRTVSLIELSTADVRQVLCNAEIRSYSHIRPINPRNAGRKPTKLETIKKAMKQDLDEGKLTEAELREMLEKNLASTYHASRDTVRKARKRVLS